MKIIILTLLFTYNIANASHKRSERSYSEARDQEERDMRQEQEMKDMKEKNYYLRNPY